jgi:hypothetical protein
MGERQKLKQLENELSRVNDGTTGPGSGESIC